MSEELTFTIIPKHDEPRLMECATALSIQEPWLTLKISKEDSYTFLKSEIVSNFGLFRKDELIGFISIQFEGALTPFIRRIAVQPSHQKMGYGKYLMEQTEKIVKINNKNIFLLVSTFNEGARNFYRRLGYIEIGILKDFVLPGYDEILMRKVL